MFLGPHCFTAQITNMSSVVPSSSAPRSFTLPQCGTCPFIILRMQTSFDSGLVWGSEIWDFLALGYLSSGPNPKIKGRPRKARISCSSFSGPSILGPSQGLKNAYWGAQLGFDNPIYCIDQYLGIKNRMIILKCFACSFLGKLRLEKGKKLVKQLLTDKPETRKLI